MEKSSGGRKAQLTLLLVKSRGAAASAAPQAGPAAAAARAAAVGRVTHARQCLGRRFGVRLRKETKLGGSKQRDSQIKRRNKGI